MRRDVFALVLLLLAVMALTVRGLDADAIWIDEYWSVYNAGAAQYGPLSPAGIIERIATEDIWHVPLYYFMVAAWGNLAGWSPFALRALSLFFGLLSIAMVYRLGRDLHSRRAGLAAAVVMAFSAFYLYYFHEMRSYTLNVFLAVLVVWAYWQAVHAQSRPRVMLALFFAATLAILYTHYLITPILMALGLYHLLFVRKDRRWWWVTGCAVLAGLLFLPWLQVTLRAFNEAANPENIALRGFDNRNPLESNVALLYLFGNGSVVLPLLVGWFARPALQNRGIDTRSPVFFAWFMVLCFFAITLILNVILALYYTPRYLLPMWPVLAFLMGLGIVKLSERRIAPALVLGAWVLGGLWSYATPNLIGQYTDERLLSPPWHTIARSLSPRVEADDNLVLLLPDDAWYVWHDWTSGFYFDPMGVSRTLVESYPYITDREYRQAARSLNSPRLWLGYDPQRLPMAWYRYPEALQRDYVNCGASITLPDYQLDLYSRIPTDADRQFDGHTGVTLVESLRADEALRPVLGWSLGETIQPQVYSVALHIVDSSGALVAQADYGLPTSPYACVQSLIDISSLPSGDHSLYAIVYNWQTGDRLPVGDTEDRLLLGSFTR